MRHWRGVDQLDHVRRLLKRDPDSRQAVIQLYDPQRDTRGHRDVPCTLNHRFFIRHGRLEMHTTMRSNDVWLGLPYDLFTATMLHELLAGWLGVELGTYHHHVDSLHVYAEHELAAAAVAESTVAPSPSMPALFAPVDGFTEFLTTMVRGDSVTDAGAPWVEMAAMLTSYRRWSAGHRPAAHDLAAHIDGDLGQALRSWYTHLTHMTELAGSARGDAQ
ncbi:Thymidylate synthase 1 [Micromonospora sp. MH33]|nr:Thymidylate synthase 1 [Micromonospora sp. MH33]